MDKFLDINFQKRRFLAHLKSFPEKERKILLHAYQIAKKSHRGQFRDEGPLYIIHPLRVASSLIEELGIKNPRIICAALLHDAIEDTDLKLEEVTKNFGNEVGVTVNNLTRKKRKETERVRYRNKYQKFLSLMKTDKNTRTVKACDWLDNMRSWVHIPKSHLSKEKLSRWLLEAEKMYIPLGKTVDQKLVIEMKKALIKAKKL